MNNFLKIVVISMVFQVNTWAAHDQKSRKEKKRNAANVQMIQNNDDAASTQLIPKNNVDSLPVDSEKIMTSILNATSNKNSNDDQETIDKNKGQYSVSNVLGASSNSSKNLNNSSTAAVASSRNLDHDSGSAAFIKKHLPSLLTEEKLQQEEKLEVQEEKKSEVKNWSIASTFTAIFAAINPFGRTAKQQDFPSKNSVHEQESATETMTTNTETNKEEK